MTTYNTLTDAALSQDKPVTQSMMRSLRDNPLSIAEGDSTAPRIDGLNGEDVQTASASSNLEFTGLSSAYDLYEFEFVDLKPNTTGSTIYLTVYTAAGGYASGQYYYARTVNDGTLSASNASNQAQVVLNMALGGSEVVNGTVKLFNPGGTAVGKHLVWELFNGSNSGNNTLVVGGAICNDTNVQSNAVTKVKFTPSSGNFTSGKIVMRPRRKAVNN